MKKRIQIVLFLAVIMISIGFLQSFWKGWLWGAVYIPFSVMALLIAILIFMENRHPSKTITWLIVLSVNPIAGFILYMLLGQSYRKKRMFAKKALQDEASFVEVGHKLPMSSGELPMLGDHQQRTLELAQHLGKSPISYHSTTQVLTNGEETFQHIIEKLLSAKHHIHLQYYIVRDDELGQRISNILIEKVKAGVEVRFLYDAVGCMDLPRSYIDQLIVAGVQMIPFFPVILPFFNNRVNFRNHRKIVVVDGRTGFIGGLNIGDEYLGKDEYFGFWRDTHLRVEGEIVRRLQLYFLRDWFYMTNEKLLDEDYLVAAATEGDNLGGVQMIAGGPDDEWDVIKNLFFSMINSAKHSIYIASPYFIPDEDILSAIKVAALSGVDVKLLVPSRPDKKIVFYASHSYFMELLEAGVKIYSYQKGFLHSKIIIVDEELASIGTSNMDMRSFHLNFEVNCFLYHTSSVLDLVRDFKLDLNDAKQIDLKAFRERKVSGRIKESLARLASPLL